MYKAIFLVSSKIWFGITLVWFGPQLLWYAIDVESLIVYTFKNNWFIIAFGIGVTYGWLLWVYVYPWGLNWWVTQGMTKAKVVQFWHGILNKKLRHQMQDVMSFGKCVIIIWTKWMGWKNKRLHLSRENLNNASTPLVQQLFGPPNKATSQKTMSNFWMKSFSLMVQITFKY